MCSSYSSIFIWYIFIINHKLFKISLGTKYIYHRKKIHIIFLITSVHRITFFLELTKLRLVPKHNEIFSLQVSLYLFISLYLLQFLLYLCSSFYCNFIGVMDVLLIYEAMQFLQLPVKVTPQYLSADRRHWGIKGFEGGAITPRSVTFPDYRYRN